MDLKLKLIQRSTILKSGSEDGIKRDEADVFLSGSSLQPVLLE